MGALRKADWREERRERAWNLKEQGWKQKDIAVALGVSEGAVSQWKFCIMPISKTVEQRGTPVPTGNSSSLTDDAIS